MTLAEAKRSIKVGTRLTMLYCKYVEMWSEPARSQIKAAAYTRPVGIVQGNGIAMVRHDDETRHSWLYWPKAVDFRSDGPDTFSILKDGEVHLSYKIEV